VACVTRKPASLLREIFGQAILVISGQKPQEEGCVFTPAVTLWAFVAQCLSSIRFVLLLTYATASVVGAAFGP